MLSYFILALWMMCFIFLGSLTFTIVTLSVSSKTVASSSKWQLSSCSRMTEGLQSKSLYQVFSERRLTLR